jgi:hypothetical protein
MNNKYFPKIVPFVRYVEKYDIGRQAAGGDIVRRREDVMCAP